MLLNFDVEDAPRSGRPVEADKGTIKALIDANRRMRIQSKQTTKEEFPNADASNTFFSISKVSADILPER
ncbi:hypothetical protein TNCV_2007171 [Trichonephila clavipes]|nr:hypothetical protein TNCV_2007171 [Trichonephila clavipes]